MHRIELTLASFSEDEHHKVRNFVEALWLDLERAGWVEPENFDHRITPDATLGFNFPARESKEAVKLVDRAIAKHVMGSLVAYAHIRKARRG